MESIAMVISQSRNEQNATTPNKEIHFVWYSRSRKKYQTW